MRTGADHRRREARNLACGRSDPRPRSSAYNAAPRIRCQHALRRPKDRSNGPQPTSMSTEDFTAHPDSKAANGSTGPFTCERAIPHNRGSSDTLENRRRRWPEREKEAFTIRPAAGDGRRLHEPAIGIADGRPNEREARPSRPRGKQDQQRVCRHQPQPLSFYPPSTDLRRRSAHARRGRKGVGRFSIPSRR